MNEIGTSLILLLAIVPAQSPQLQQPQYSVLAIQYVGIQDKPVFPIVISDSKDGAEWYQTAVLKQKTDMSLTRLHVVDAPLMAKLIKETASYSGIARKGAGPRSRSSELVVITVVKAGKRSTVRLSIQSGILLLENLKNVCGGDTSLYSILEGFQESIQALAGGQGFPLILRP
jgi:hypothetical protein